jgi:uncharacterized protein (TIGR03067 family)
MAGDKLPDELLQNNELAFTENRFKSLANGDTSTGTIKLDMTSEPRGMDIVFEDGVNQGKTMKCIYKIEDDCLHVAYSLAFDDVRPIGFESNQDNKLLLIVYELSGLDKSHVLPQPDSSRGKRR